MTVSSFIIIGVCTILLPLLTSLLNPFFRLAKRDGRMDTEPEGADLPKISVVLLVNSEAERLQQCLHKIVRQDYGQDYEVIAVLEKGDLVSEGIVQQNNIANRIYATFIPSRPIFMSKEKLAVTLGVKASHYEWIALVSSESVPCSDKWLLRMARHCSNGCDMVMGYSNYDLDTPSYWRFMTLRENLYYMRLAQKHMAYRAAESNLLFRKSMFIKGDGYRENLQFRNGEYDFIVNKYAVTDNIAVETSCDSAVMIEPPTKKHWTSKCLSRKYTNKGLHRSWLFSLLYYCDLIAMYGNYAVQMALLIYGICMRDAIIIAASCFGIALTLTLRTIIARKAINLYNAQIKAYKAVLYELSIGFRNAANMWRYMRSDKTEYITHKI